MGGWISDNQALLTWLAGASVVVFVGTLVAAPIVLLRIPADYFQRGAEARGRSEWSRRHPAAGLALRIARNALGWVLIVAGLAMLVLPGQGVVVLLLGIALAEFPGKFRLQRWLISRPRVLKPVNRFRVKRGRPPLEID